MTDSRKHPRGYTDGYLVVWNDKTGMPIGRLRNLTIDGCMLICTDPVKTPAVIHCRMTLPDIIEGIRDLTFIVDGKWCRQNQRAGWYELGCAFVNLSVKGSKIINHLVEEWMIIGETADAACRGTIPR
ncbi:MAG: PilZ domain-containing protein [candidate division Zixibacteria bacterium]|nr:PilZ domain-containing protein [candidate division Zixibacteria bacterium]MDH3939196.1 PilZ domain-containing protein [candidate division Zixibacteria bacterium]MDH4034476.1 PilZ domain-containing protein [candidate division Zixibacteria bacterium]